MVDENLKENWLKNTIIGCQENAVIVTGLGADGEKLSRKCGYCDRFGC